MTRAELDCLRNSSSVSEEKVAGAMNQAVKVLERRHGAPGQYKSVSMDQQMESANKITGIMTLIIGAIAGISLFVGGIGGPAGLCFFRLHRHCLWHLTCQQGGPAKSHRGTEKGLIHLLKARQCNFSLGKDPGGPCFPCCLLHCPGHCRADLLIKNRGDNIFRG